MRRASSVRRNAVSANTTDVAARILEFLRARYPLKTAENVAADTGYSIPAIEKWFARRSIPSGLPMILLIAAYGPEFLAAVMPNQAWITRAAQMQRLAELEARQAAVAREIASLRDQAHAP